MDELLHKCCKLVKKSEDDKIDPQVMKMLMQLEANTEKRVNEKPQPVSTLEKLLGNWAVRHYGMKQSLEPDIKYSPDLDRAAIPKSLLSPDILRSLGFFDSVVATPEPGQYSLLTFRQPRTQYHVHEHPEHWFVHHDEYKPLQEVRRESDVSFKDVVQGISHALLEGVPGWLNWADKVQEGAPTFDYRVEHPEALDYPEKIIHKSGEYTMPHGVNEKEWNQAKSLAAKEGKPKNWAYVMSIYKKLTKKAGTTADRARVKKKNFGLPGKAENKEEKKKSGNYPINTEGRARSALAYSKRFASPDEQAEIKRRVKAKYPGMKVGSMNKRIDTSAKVVEVPLVIRKKDATVKVAAELANTDSKKRRGLGGREKLAAGEGMLFPGSTSFWMKGVPFDLDLLGLAKTGEVLDIQHMQAASTIPDVMLPVYQLQPEEKVAFALEVPGGWCDDHHIGVGDIVDIDL